MQRSKVLVINDYAVAGGAEVIYQHSINVLEATPGVQVECFDLTRAGLSESALTKIWNVPAARALAKILEVFRPNRVLVHNYHNALSSSVLRVLMNYKRNLGFSAYMTCHDYYSVYYNSSLMQYVNDTIQIFPIESLGRSRALLSRTSEGSLIYDIAKKMHWHISRLLGNPAELFDMYLCPSPFMQTALIHAGMSNAVVLKNPAVWDRSAIRPEPVKREKISLAYVGRIVAEKGLPQFLTLAQSTSFEHIDRILIYGAGPDLAKLQVTFSSMIESGRLIFKGSFPRAELFDELTRDADAIILPSVGAENAPLVIVEAAMLGLPVMTPDIGSLSTFADEVGNKIKYSNERGNFGVALQEVIAHLATPDREYDVSHYSLPFYSKSLLQIMQIGEKDTA